MWAAIAAFLNLIAGLFRRDQAKHVAVEQAKEANKREADIRALSDDELDERLRRFSRKPKP